MKPNQYRHHPLLESMMALCLPLVLTGQGLAADGRTGEQIYREQCAACHGKQGEGSKEYGHPLVGDRSVSQLAKFIAKTMPDDDPGTCVGEDAEQVAAYIHDAFYSKTAQARNKPPRIELSRLTVRQYQNTITDLIGSFRAPGKWDGPHGLRGEYYKTQRMRRNSDRAADRIDPEVDFNFGTASADPNSVDGKEFAIRWEGSVLAPETGDYVFNVHTEHSVRLWVNDLKRPLIDAWVMSGKDTEHRESIRLLAGRIYPIKLEFLKGKQGVKDKKDPKEKPPPPVKASIALRWKAPNRAEEVIPQRNLTPSRFPESFVLQTPFPPDDRSVGYERGTSISKAWDQATTDAAIEVVSYISTRLGELAGVKEDAKDREARLREFCTKLAERAFRRPLTDDQKKLFIDRPFKNSRDLDLAVKRTVLLVLKSPRFLYHEIGGGLDAHDVACRLSYGLWDSLPDQPLLDAAAAGKLTNRDQVAQQAARMVSDLRTRAKVREFLLQWLRVDRAPDISKDPKLFPRFGDAIASDLRTSLDLFLDDVVWGGDTADFRRFLLADELYLNGRLAQFYGAALPPDASFQKVSLNAKERVGLLTHPYLMTTFAYTGSTSPIHRGVFLARGVLGRSLPAPPAAVAPLAPDLHASLTTRERVALQTSPKSCQMCHGMINPLGYTLEHFDAVGRYRDDEKGKPIDATGTYQTRSGEAVTLQGAKGLASFLAGSEETHSAFVQQLFHYLVKQPVRAFGAQELAELRQFFVAHDFNIRKLMVEIMASSALTPRNARAKVHLVVIPADPWADVR
jgi:hypothetical protein